MLAIYKKELKSYFHSMIGYVFMAFFLVVVGIYMFSINIVSQAANFEYVLSSVIFVFIILVPVLTMRVIAEEKKQKTDQLLFTSSISMIKIVLAKYLAVVSLFAVTMLVVCVYPLILSIYGDMPFIQAYTSIFGFFLMGCTLIAVGVFISALTESQIIAAVISFIVLLISYLADKLSTLMPTDKLPTMVITILLFAAFCFVIYLSMRNVYVSVGIGVVGTVGLILAYFFYGSFYDNLLYKLINSIALMKRFDNFVYGTVYLADIIYYLSITALFVTLTSLFMKDNLADKMRKGSTFRTSLMVIATVLCVVINLFAGQLNLFADFSANKMFSITQDTVDFVKDINNNITIYYLTGTDYEDASVSKVVNKYNGINSKVKVEKKDLVLYPNFAKKYTSDQVMDNTVIVVNEDTEKFKIVSYEDMYEFDQNSGQITGSKVESQITAALDYVMSEETAVLYYTTGHGEIELGNTLLSESANRNITPKSLATVTVDSIPDDCKVLVINGPTVDFSDDEINMIRVYLANGGDIIISLQQTDKEMPNFKELLNYYGVYQKKGIIVEEYGSYVTGSRSAILPILGQHPIVSDVNDSGRYVVMPNCSGLAASDTARDTITSNVLMKTSEGSYAKVNFDSSTAEFEEGDIRGPLDVAVIAEEKSEDTKETMSMVVFGSAYAFCQEICGSGQFANTEVFGDTLSYMVPASSNVSISAVNMSTVYLSIPAVTQVVLGIVFVILLPLAILVSGLVIWLRRRKA